jgi:hypothetical protein
MSYPDRSLDLNQDGVGMTNGALRVFAAEQARSRWESMMGFRLRLAVGECARDDIVNVA